jgi:hypothetical protein
VRLGTTTIRSLVILLRILQLGLPKGCAGYSHQALEVKGDGFSCDLGKVTRFRAFGEGEFTGFSYAWAVLAVLILRSGPLAASRRMDATHELAAILRDGRVAASSG